MLKQFESYGASLRNMYGPYWYMSDIIEVYRRGELDESILLHFIDNIDIDNIKKNKKDLITFSKLPLLEEANIRETNFRNYNSYDEE